MARLELQWQTEFVESMTPRVLHHHTFNTVQLRRPLNLSITPQRQLDPARSFNAELLVPHFEPICRRQRRTPAGSAQPIR